MTTKEYYSSIYSGKISKLRVQKEPYHKDLLNFTKFLPTESTPMERIYCLINNITSVPVCEREGCDECVKFPHHLSKTDRYYRRFCSTKCSNNDNNVQIEKSKTCMLNYGVDNPSKNDHIHQKKVKTITENYGGFLMQSPTLKKQILETNLERYGNQHPIKTPEIQRKSKQSIYKKYGKIGRSHPDIISKIRKTKLERYGLSFTPIPKSYFSKIATKYIENYIKINNINKNLCKYADSEIYIRNGSGISYYDLVVFRSKRGFDENDYSDICLILEYDGRCWHPNINESITYRDKMMPFNSSTFREKYLRDLRKIKLAKDLMVKNNGKFVIYKENQIVRTLP